MVVLWNSPAESHWHFPSVQEAPLILQSESSLQFFEHSSTPIRVECDWHSHLLLKPHDNWPEHCELAASGSHIPPNSFSVEEKSKIIWTVCIHQNKPNDWIRKCPSFGNHFFKTGFNPIFFLTLSSTLGIVTYKLTTHLKHKYINNKKSKLLLWGVGCAKHD